MCENAKNYATVEGMCCYVYMNNDIEYQIKKIQHTAATDIHLESISALSRTFVADAGL